MLVGAWLNENAGRQAGTVYLVRGSAAPTTRSLAEADALFTGESAGHGAGYSVASAGDVDGDGLGDVLVGAYANDEGGVLAGAAYLLLGSAEPSSRSLGEAEAQYTGEAPEDRAGASVSGAGDVNGDGSDDVLVGALVNGAGGVAAGAAYLVLGGGAPSSRPLAEADARFIGAAPGDGAGNSVASAGDVDGDGFDDVLVGAPANDDAGEDAGAVYLVRGAPAPGGDVNADGLGDLLIGAHPDDGFRGAAYLVLGKAP